MLSPILSALKMRQRGGPSRARGSGANGVCRKLEFAPPRGLGGKKRGKRNLCRVCYVYFEEFHAVLLVTACAKGRKEDITYEEKVVY